MNDEKRGWTFFSNHGHVLVCLARDSDARVRDVAQRVGITERAALKIINELEQGSVIGRRKEGRRNRYDIYADAALRHPLEAHRDVGSLLKMVLEPEEVERLGLLEVTKTPVRGAKTSGKSAKPSSKIARR